ncbi:MAG TPA: hypothetical protein VF556_11330 [Pyrinomonadaceae bacterium]|jgi:hypothetical protein
MKRIQEKVKDIVEVRSYEIIQDFISNPSVTLANYYFTDITSDLMGKWLDAIAGIQHQKGTAFALAGYRGVGKSHFLATLGAIVSQPELRLKISEPHVSISSQQLKRRRHLVSFVKRGLQKTLFDELKAAVALTFTVEPETLGDTVSDLLNFAAARSTETPFVLLIDTAFERTSRVLRDDGEMLGEIAEVARNLNIFVGVALDDDIAGADGVNAAISKNYKIDYLDQEHLYRIVDTYIFPKQRHLLPVLHDIYKYFRMVLPDFRWSEHRFSSLYPLHPSILETAPYVRLYVPDFALLSFASEAGTKILGRPANSLIGLDEVFDCVESRLRRVEELKEAFEVYDRINAQVVAQIPIMQRLQAKLALKALMLLSFDGDGTTAGEINAAILIFDENETNKSRSFVEDLLENFVSAFPQDIQKIVSDGRENRYKFKVESKENLNNALIQASYGVSHDVIPQILCRVAQEKFGDWTILDEVDTKSTNSMECSIKWRGGTRGGRISWNLRNEKNENDAAVADSEFIDWNVIITRLGKATESQNEKKESPTAYWQPDALREDERETILRFHVLLTDKKLREEYSEQIRAAGHAHTTAIEKIWNRIFFQDAKFVVDGLDFNFTEEARVAQNVSEVLTIMLEPLFEMRYPAHPFFTKTLGIAEVSTLVNDLFSGARQNLENVQQLAETFALPLGLVAMRGGLYVPESEESLQNLPLARKVLEIVQASGENTVSLKTIYKELKKSPHGLVREAQQLLLTALVAQRQIEFVTSKEDRINRRSLDLKIIWEDITGVAKPTGVVYSNEKLTNWAKILTATESFHSIEIPEDRKIICEELQNWLDEWNNVRVLQRFKDLPDEILNTKIWHLAICAEKTFGSVAEVVKAVLDESISLVEGLHRIADAFSDSKEIFYKNTQDLLVLEDFIKGAQKRKEIWTYLALCEPTEDEKIEHNRAKLLRLIEESYAQPSESLNEEMENLWRGFKAEYSEHYAIIHDTLMKSNFLQDKYDEILRSNEWWEFENLSKNAIFQQKYWLEAQKIRRQLKQLDCRYPVREMLKTHPFCGCSFSLSQIKQWENLPQSLWQTVNRGRISYRRNLLMLKDPLLPLIEQESVQTTSERFSVAAKKLIASLQSDINFPVMTNDELIVLQRVFADLPTAPVLHLRMPVPADYSSREKLQENFNKWLEDLPDEPVLIKI